MRSRSRNTSRSKAGSTMPTGRLTAPSRLASQTPDVSRRDQPPDGQESDAGHPHGPRESGHAVEKVLAEQLEKATPPEHGGQPPARPNLTGAEHHEHHARRAQKSRGEAGPARVGRNLLGHRAHALAGQERGNPVEDAGGQLRHTMSTSELMP